MNSCGSDFNGLLKSDKPMDVFDVLGKVDTKSFGISACRFGPSWPIKAWLLTLLFSSASASQNAL